MILEKNKKRQQFLIKEHHRKWNINRGWIWLDPDSDSVNIRSDLKGENVTILF